MSVSSLERNGSLGTPRDGSAVSCKHGYACKSKMLTSSVSVKESSPLITSSCENTGSHDRHFPVHRYSGKSVNHSNSWVFTTSDDFSHHRYHQSSTTEYKGRPTSTKEYVCVSVCVLVAMALFCVPLTLHYITFEVGESVSLS